MLSNGSIPLLQRRFRANDGYEFVPFRRLAPAERALFADLADHSEHAGILRPAPGTALGVKNATRSIAALTRLLRQPAHLPHRVRSSPYEQITRDIASLVLESVLEVEEGGTFVSGPDAADVLLDTPVPAPANGDAIAMLSDRALRYANALAIDDASALSARLYFYNRQPATPTLAHRLTSEKEVERFLGVDADGSLARTIQRFWNRAPVADLPGWISLRSRFRLERRSETLPTYKLYLSPVIDAVPDALRIAVPILAQHSAPDFKFGSDLFGLVRPDKIVVYLDTLTAVAELGDAMRVALADIEGHGVPFTAGLADGTLLSWGVDPPRAIKLLKWRETESWRLWVTNRIAQYMLAARAAGACTLSPRDYALARLRFEGVDISTWTPNPSIWSQHDWSAGGDN